MQVINIIAGFLFLLWWVKISFKDLKQAEPEDPHEEKPQQAEPPRIDRRKLEEIAANCLHLSGCRFDLWTYCRNKSDTELMDIIKDFNYNN